MTTPPRAWLALAVLTLPTLLLSVDATVLLLAIPAIAADLGPTATETLWIVDAYGFVLAILLLPMGALGDRVGRKRLLLWGAAAFGAASVLAAFAATPLMLIAARVLLGAAAATLMPSTLALIRTLFTDDRARGVAIGIWASAFSVGVAIGPIIGGALLEVFAWGAVFLIAVPIMVLLLVTGPFLLPEQRGGAQRIDPVSVVLALVTTGAVIGAVKLIAEGALPLPVGIGLLVAGLGLGILFARRQVRVPGPIVDPALLAERGVRPALGVMLAGLATLGVYLFVTQYLQQDAGMPPLKAGLALVLPALGLVATSLAAPVLANRFGSGPVLAGGFAAMTVGAVGMVLAPTFGVVAVVASFGVYYLGIGPLMSLGTSIVVGRASEHRAGSAAALSESTLELGLAFGFAVLGSIGTAVLTGGEAHHGGDVAAALPVVGTIVAATALALAVVTPRVLRAEAPRQDAEVEETVARPIG